MRLRFTLRDLFWLVIVMALSVGWWLDHRPERMPDQYTVEHLNNGLTVLTDNNAHMSWAKHDNKWVEAY